MIAQIFPCTTTSQVQLFKNDRVQTPQEPNLFVPDFIRVVLGKGFYQYESHCMTFD